MKIQLDNSPAKLEISTPHGVIEIEVWPTSGIGACGGGSSTHIIVKPNLEHSDQCLRSDDGSRIILKPRS